MEALIITALYTIAIVIVVGVVGSMLRRIGYSWWFSLLLFVPIANIVSLFLLAVKQWPIERDLARLRLIAEESVDIDADIESVISHAIRCEKKRQWDQAISLYNFAAEVGNNPQVKQYALESTRRLKTETP